ncbi:MAG: hypothetical protein Q8P84_07100 [Deltaproteobacteria bacterium]|nr:hypothetical protein [Deltaproteobacteria bacterium]MDZ4225027.1 hypothetical protein [bacterium]
MFGMHHGFFSFAPHIAVFLGLIALAFGYKVCQQAKSDATCGKWGKFVGIFISAVSLLGLACVGYLSIKRCCKMDKKDAWMEKHMQMMMPPSEEPQK